MIVTFFGAGGVVSAQTSPLAVTVTADTLAALTAAQAAADTVAADADRAEAAADAVPALLADKIDRVPGADLRPAEPAFAVGDGDHNVLEVGQDGSTRLADLQVDQDIARPEAWTMTTGTPGWPLAFMDLEGNIGCGFKADENRWVFHGLQADGPGPDPDPEPITHAVSYAFAEPYDDPSQNLLLTWVSDSATARVIEYRPEGGSTWQPVGSHRSRPFPNVADRYLHTALLRDLGSDMVINLRWPGATHTDTVRTSRRSGVRVCITSDYQRSTYGPGSHVDLFGQQMTAQVCDVVVWNGDYVTDDGQWTPTMGQRWFDFMERLSVAWRRDGALVPMAATLGNHEGRNAAGTSNALASGDGTPGPMIDIFSLGYDADAPEYRNRSAWSFSVGREVGFVAYETSHTVMIADQLAWLDATLDEMAPRVRHLNLVGHSPAFYARNPFNWESLSLQAVTIKRDVWPLMEQHAGKMRAYWVGHEHGVSATARLRMDWDAGLTDAENGVRWITDPVGGVRQLGSGMIGGGTAALPAGHFNDPSSIDGSPRMIAAIGYDGTAFSTHGPVDVSGTAGPYNLWIADYSATDFTARAIDHAGHEFFSITEAV